MNNDAVAKAQQQLHALMSLHMGMTNPAQTNLRTVATLPNGMLLKSDGSLSQSPAANNVQGVQNNTLMQLGGNGALHDALGNLGMTQFQIPQANMQPQLPNIGPQQQPQQQPFNVTGTSPQQVMQDMTQYQSQNLQNPVVPLNQPAFAADPLQMAIQKSAQWGGGLQDAFAPPKQNLWNTNNPFGYSPWSPQAHGTGLNPSYAVPQFGTPGNFQTADTFGTFDGRFPSSQISTGQYDGSNGLSMNSFSNMMHMGA